MALASGCDVVDGIVLLLGGGMALVAGAEEVGGGQLLVEVVLLALVGIGGCGGGGGRCVEASAVGLIAVGRRLCKRRPLRRGLAGRLGSGSQRANDGARQAGRAALVGARARRPAKEAAGERAVESTGLR